MLLHEQPKISRIHRQKLVGPGRHWGVWLPNFQVVEYSSDHGPRFLSADQFGAGYDVVTDYEVPHELTHVVHDRLQRLLQNPPKYDLVSWNCETFARWLTEGTPQSQQINGIAILAAGAGALALLNALG